MDRIVYLARGMTATDRGQGVPGSRIDVPRPGRDLSPRPRLTALLEEGLDTKLTVVTGPPGAGKTSAVVDWLGRRPDDGRPVAWLTLGKGDNDAQRLWTDLLAAIQRLGVEVEDLSTSISRSDDPPDESVVIAVVNRLAEALDDGGILVVDDLHELHETPVLRTFKDFATLVPDQLTLVLVSRASLPWSVDRLRGSGQLTEVTNTHLSFLVDEADRWLRGTAGLGITDEQLARLVERTEGWATGLQLAVVCIRRSTDPAAAIRAFVATNEVVSGYLFREAIDSLDDDLRTFLFEVAVLERFDADACAALTGRADSGELLSAARRSNLFVLRLDEEGRWFRFHDLFRSLLEATAERLDPGRRRQLHARASQIFADRGEVDLAVRHAARSDDRRRAAELIMVNAEPMSIDGRGDVVRSWTELFDDDDLDDVELASAVIVGLGLVGDARRALALLGRLDEAGVGPETTTALIRPSLISTAQTGSTDLLPAIVQRIRNGWSELPPAQERRVRYAEAWIAADREQWDTAEVMYRSLRADSNERDLKDASIPGRLARVLRARGRLNEGSKMAEESVELCTRLDGLRSSVVCHAHIAAGQIAHDRYDLVEAERRLAEALATTEPLRHLAIPSLVAMSLVRLSQGRSEDAASSLERAGKLQHRIPDASALRRAVALGRVHLALDRSDRAQAVAWAREFDNTGDVELPAALRMRVDGPPSPTKLDEAVDRALAANGAAAEPLAAVEELVVLAGWCADAGREGAAVRLLGRAVALAEPEDLVRPFADDALVSGLFRQHFVELAESSTPAFVEHVIVSAAREDHNRRHGISHSELTEQERLVLGYLCDGLTYAEIGERLYVSKNTVKTHVRHVYSKLGVSGRAAAVERARVVGAVT